VHAPSSHAYKLSPKIIVPNNKTGKIKQKKRFTLAADESNKYLWSFSSGRSGEKKFVQILTSVGCPDWKCGWRVSVAKSGCSTSHVSAVDVGRNQG
jgi:hypothetical protein